MIRFFVVAILCLWLTPFRGRAQVCTGSLGDPVLNETFGTDNFTLPPYKTSLAFFGGCPPPEKYTISSFLFGCGDAPGAWVKMIGDHTANTHGNYMLVNAQNHSGAVYVDTVRGICGATVYQFGAWITSVLTKYACNGQPVLPDLQLRVTSLSGDVIGSIQTGGLPIVDDREWKFYGFLFTTPAGIDDVIVSISINAAPGCGAAFGLDDITLRPCGPLISATLNGTTDPVEVCADYTNPQVITANYTPGFSDPVLQWQNSLDTGKTWLDIPGEASLTYAIPHRDSGIIEYRVAIAERQNINSLKCRVTSNIISTTVYPVPQHFQPQLLYGCLGKDFLLPKASTYALSLLWSGPDGYSSDATNAAISPVQLSDTGLYTLKQTYRGNCISLDSFYVQAKPGTSVLVQPVHPLCDGESEQLTASANGNVSYKWTPSTGLSNDAISNPVARPTDSTQYKVVVTNEYGCKDSARLQINVYRNPVADAGADKTILAGDTAVLNGFVKGTSVNYYWTPSTYMNNDHLVIPKVYPLANTSYSLNVMSTLGCGTATDVVNVKVYSDFYIPSAFTPNGDGKNDVFRVLQLDNYQLKHLLIYNRWGQLVFKSEGTFGAWDGTIRGTPQPAGLYVYHLEMNSGNNKKIERQGTIMLIR